MLSLSSFLPSRPVQLFAAKIAQIITLTGISASTIRPTVKSLEFNEPTAPGRDPGYSMTKDTTFNKIVAGILWDRGGEFYNRYTGGEALMEDVLLDYMAARGVSLSPGRFNRYCNALISFINNGDPEQWLTMDDDQGLRRYEQEALLLAHQDDDLDPGAESLVVLRHRWRFYKKLYKVTRDVELLDQLQEVKALINDQIKQWQVKNGVNE